MTDMDMDDDERPSRRLLPLAVFAVLALASVVGAVLMRSFVEDQEQRLLEQRASEASTVISSLIDEMTATLPMLGALAEAVPGSEAAILERLAPDDSPVVIGTASRVDDEIVAGAVSGGGAGAGEPLTGRRLMLVERALTSDGIVSTVDDRADGRYLLFAVATGGDRALFQELAFDPGFLWRGDGDQPFSELDGAVYAARGPVSDRLAFATTRDLPITGDVVREAIDVGADEWTLVAKSREPLVGALAANAHWYLLAVSLLTAAMLATMIAIVNRRRTYAVRLVETRTRELRAAREAADQANRSKSEFLSRMSHELRTPLNAVLGFGQLLELEELGQENDDAVRQILRGGRHLLDLINEVLDMTRIESGTFQLSPEPVLVSDVLGDVAQLTAPLAAQSNVQLGTNDDACTVHVQADRQRLNQVLLNLISNAIKYNRVGGSVTLSCEPAGSAALRIKVHDTGPGIRDDDLELLFLPFERLGAEQTSVEGTGIGLALSRRLAEAMGGTLDVETILGEGSTFWIELPVVEGPVDRLTRMDSEEQPVSVPAPGAPTRTVLYIEDNLANLRLVERVLAYDPSITLISAGQGRLGLDLARDHLPELVLLDLHLPDLGGDEVLRQLRNDPVTESIPVVILSADATPGQIKRLLRAGALTYITKPLDVTALRKIVEDLPVVAP